MFLYTFHIESLSHQKGQAESDDPLRVILRGHDGEPRAQGPPGRDGATGPQGPPGPSSGGVTYVRNHLSRHNRH